MKTQHKSDKTLKVTQKYEKQMKSKKSKSKSINKSWYGLHSVEC